MNDEIKAISKENVEKSRAVYGANELKRRKKKSFFKYYLKNLNDPIIKILIAALFISTIISLPKINYLESLGIALSILVSTLVSTISEYSGENAFERLRQSSENTTVFVKRDGGVVEIDPKYVVCGDILILEAGAKIAADAVLFDGNLMVDEAALTGESAEAHKTPINAREIAKIQDDIYSRLNEGSAKHNNKATSPRRESILYSGATVTQGYGEALVVAVGESTFLGKEAGALTTDTRPSPLKTRLTSLAKSISRIGYACAALIAVSYLFNSFVIDSSFNPSEIISRLTDVKFLISHLINAITLAVSVTVVAVPEGLPMMITVVLSSNMKKMARDNVLVKKLVGIETSGNIDLLFTDKTGTLTEGKLKVKEVIANGKSLSVQEIKAMEKFKEYLTLCAYFCTNATKQGTNIITTDATERTLISYAAFYKPKCKVLEKIPFDSTKKYSCVSVLSEYGKISIFKGAPEKIIAGSTRYFDENGDEVSINAQKIRELYEEYESHAKQGNRVIAIGIKTENSDTSPDKMTFLCFISLRDRLRKETRGAIKEVQGAGVGVVMITGDGKLTAQSVARECGIISVTSQRSLVLESSDLQKMSDSEIAASLPHLAVVARALPSDKHRLVKISQENGYTVGMTGDGVNDASSLKSADVGFAMGSGTEVAKECADIVIKDNNFASIVKAVLYGRTIFESIRKFIIFQLIMNFSAVGISLIGPFIGVDTPVTVTQMLWLNIIMDTLGALAFATEPPLSEYMQRKPKKRSEQILSRKMIKQIALVTSYILILCVWFLKSNTGALLLTKGTEKYLLSSFFALFVFLAVFVCFISRTHHINIFKGLLKNKCFTLIMILIVLVQIVFIYFGGEALRTSPLNIFDLMRVFLCAFSVVVYDTVRKIVSHLFSLKRIKQKTKFERKISNVK
ncbi:MAG: cation-translocating P-type ATPase [Clostridia bacterium]|nr:cation-translocating P-type ATPase [Clostridia bacterium]